MDRRKPELLSPAGDMEKLRMAVAYGADAVYLAGTSFGMRSFTANFTPDELPQAIKLAHDAGVKVHCTVNIMPRNDEAAVLPAYLEQLDAAGAISRRSSRWQTTHVRRAGLVSEPAASCLRGS